MPGRTQVASQPHCPSRPNPLQAYPIRLMQHRNNPVELGQQINLITSNSKPEVLLQRLSQAVGEAFQVDGCSITVIADNNQLQTRWYNSHSVIIHQILPSGTELLKATQTSCEPIVIDDAESAETISAPVRAVLAISTQFQGKTNGVIALIRTQPSYWSESEKEQLKSTAVSVAIAISQVIQTTLIAALQQQVHRCNEYQSLIEQLTTINCSSLELDQILHLAIAATAKTLQVDRGLILTLKYADLFKRRDPGHFPKARATVAGEWLSSQQALGIAASSSDDAPQQHTCLNQSFWVSECVLCQQALISSKRVVINSQADLLVNPLTGVAPLFNLPLLPAFLLFPLESQGTVLGFLVLQNAGDRLWRSEELELLELVRVQLSTVIIQHQRLRQVQSLVEERTAQLQRSLEVQGKLYEKTRQQIDQLRHFNQLKDEFVSNMSHELRTPLTSINLAIRMLRQPGLPAERQARYLDILEQQCNQEINLINDLLTLQELESQQVPLLLQTVDLKPKIQDLAHSFEKTWESKGLAISVDLPTPLRLQTDADSLDRILQELLTNAGKYSQLNTVVTLKATRQSQDNQIVFSLTNIGMISPEFINYIFDKFRRGEGVTQQAIQGTGLGLALVKCLVQHLNGTIAVSSYPIADDPTMSKICFTVTLPQFDHAKPYFYCEQATRAQPGT